MDVNSLPSPYTTLPATNNSYVDNSIANYDNVYYLVAGVKISDGSIETGEEQKVFMGACVYTAYVDNIVKYYGGGQVAYDVKLDGDSYGPVSIDVNIDHEAFIFYSSKMNNGLIVKKYDIDGNFVSEKSLETLSSYDPTDILVIGNKAICTYTTGSVPAVAVINFDNNTIMKPTVPFNKLGTSAIIDDLKIMADGRIMGAATKKTTNSQNTMYGIPVVITDDGGVWSVTPFGDHANHVSFYQNIFSSVNSFNRLYYTTLRNGEVAVVNNDIQNKTYSITILDIKGNVVTTINQGSYGFDGSLNHIMASDNNTHAFYVMTKDNSTGNGLPSNQLLAYDYNYDPLYSRHAEYNIGTYPSFESFFSILKSVDTTDSNNGIYVYNNGIEDFQIVEIDYTTNPIDVNVRYSITNNDYTVDETYKPYNIAKDQNYNAVIDNGKYYYLGGVNTTP